MVTKSIGISIHKHSIFANHFRPHAKTAYEKFNEQ